MTFSRTICRREAAYERTGTYLPRVLESVIPSCEWLEIQNAYLA
jgi:hypothetical protein